MNEKSKKFILRKANNGSVEIHHGVMMAHLYIDVGSDVDFEKHFMNLHDKDIMEITFVKTCKECHRRLDGKNDDDNES